MGGPRKTDPRPGDRRAVHAGGDQGQAARRQCPRQNVKPHGRGQSRPITHRRKLHEPQGDLQSPRAHGRLGEEANDTLLQAGDSVAASIGSGNAVALPGAGAVHVSKEATDPPGRHRRPPRPELEGVEGLRGHLADQRGPLYPGVAGRGPPKRSSETPRPEDLAPGSDRRRDGEASPGVGDGAEGTSRLTARRALRRRRAGAVGQAQKGVCAHPFPFRKRGIP